MVERGPGKGKPTKVKNLVWRNGWAYARATINGKEHTKPLRTRSPREAEDLAREFVVDLKKTGGATRETPTFRQLVDHFTNTHLPRISTKTQTRYLNSLLNLHQFMDGKLLSEIGSALLSQYEAARRKVGITSSTIRRDLYTLSIAYNVFIEDERWEMNPVLPFLRSAKRRGLTEAEPRNRFLSIEEGETMERTAKNMNKREKHTRDMLAYFIPLNILIGGRLAEMYSIRKRDLDFDRNEVTLKGKRNKVRTIPLMPRAVELLKKLMREHSHPHCEYIFFTLKGKRFTDVWHPFQDAADIAGITDVTAHDLRRTCGVRLLRGIGGMPQMTMAEVSLWMGHSSVKVTERVYAFLSVDELHRAIRFRPTFDSENSRYITGGKYRKDLEIDGELGDDT